MAYEMVMPYHLHMPSYFLETFTEYPYIAVFCVLWENKKSWFRKSGFYCLFFFKVVPPATENRFV